MEILKWVWRVAFLITAVIVLWPMVYMQYAFSTMGNYGSPSMIDTGYSMINMLSLLSTPLLIWIPVEVFFNTCSQIRSHLTN